MNNLITGSEKKILIYRTGSLGDTIVALPALHLIRKTFPDAECWLLTDQSEKNDVVLPRELLEGSGLIDHYIHYTADKWKLYSFFSTLKEIRRIHADILFYLPEWRSRKQLLRDRFFFLLAGFCKPIGWNSNPEFYRSEVLADGLSLHETDRLLRSIQGLGQIDPSQTYWWNLQLQDKDAVKQNIITEWHGKSIVFSYGAKTDVQKWGIDKWQKVLAAVSREYSDIILYAVGSEVDRDDTEAILNYWHGTALNLCGEIRVRQTAWLMKDADLFLGHDSGPAHLAAAVQTPCVCVYSARNPFGKWFPYGKHTIFYSQVSCRGCGKSVCRQEKKKCIRMINERQVACAVIEHLKGDHFDVDTS